MSSRHGPSPRDREKILKRFNHICQKCTQPILPGQPWHAHHDIEHDLTGRNDWQAYVPHHVKCHREHTAEISTPRIKKTRQQRWHHLGCKGPGLGRYPMRCGRRSKFTHTMRHGVMRRRTLSEKIADLHRSRAIVPTEED